MATTMTEKKIPALRVTNVSKHFGGVQALNGASIEVHHNEIVALVGNNGAGKSTLMNIVCGSLTPDTGTIELDGEEVSIRTPWQARAHGIEFVPQALALAEDLSVPANVYLGREEVRKILGIPFLDKKKMKREAQKTLEQFGISIPDYNARVFDLSGGQKQGVAIGRAIAWVKQLIVLDEPTAALGPYETSKVEESVSKLKKADIAVIMVSHNIDQIFRVADRAYVLRRGEIVGERVLAETTPEELVGLITGALES